MDLLMELLDASALADAADTTVVAPEPKPEPKADSNADAAVVLVDTASHETTGAVLLH